MPNPPRHFPPPAGREGSLRRAAAWAVGALTLAALLGWIVAAWLPRTAPEAPAAVAAAPKPIPGTGHRTPAAAPSAAALAPSAVAVPAPAPRAAAAPAYASLAVDEGTEVCGWGRVHLPADDPFPLQRLPTAARRAALDEAQAGMAADADVRVRAAGLLLGARSAATGARSRIEQLARLAAASPDATAYAMALQACRAQADAAAGACGLLGTAQAAQLEPDNAQPWLALAAEAAARQDAEAEHDAMRRAAQATQIGTHDAALPLLVAQALPAPGASLQRTLALGVALGLQDIARLMPAPGGTAQARSYCLSAAGAGAGGPDTDARGASCRGLALLLLQRGPSVAELGAGLDIARRWLPGQPGLGTWQQEHDALIDTAPPLADGIDLGCAAQQQQLDWLRRVAALGERAALREQLAASGHSIAEWSARHRRSLQLAQATVAAVVDEDTADTGRPAR